MARILFALRAKKGVARRESRNRTRSWQSADTRLLQANFTRSVSISTAAAAPIRLAIRISNAPAMPLPAFSIHCAWHCQCSLPPPPMGGSFTQVLAGPEGLEALMRIATWSKDPGRGRYGTFLYKHLIVLPPGAAAEAGGARRDGRRAGKGAATHARIHAVRHHRLHPGSHARSRLRGQSALRRYHQGQRARDRGPQGDRRRVPGERAHLAGALRAGAAPLRSERGAGAPP